MAFRANFSLQKKSYPEPRILPSYTTAPLPEFESCSFFKAFLLSRKQYLDKALTATYERKGITNEPKTWKKCWPEAKFILQVKKKMTIEPKSLYITQSYSTITTGYRMVKVTENGKNALKLIFTDFLTSYNSYNIKDKLGLSNAGSLKLLRSLHEKNLLTSEKMGNAIFYKPNLENEYLLKLLELIFLDNSEASTFVKGWVYDLESLTPYTKAIFLFGSILRKGKEAHDVDVSIILKKSEDYKQLQEMVNQMNQNNRLKIHPLFLTKEGFEKKLSEKDKPLIEMVKTCIVVHNPELFVEVLKNVRSK